MPDASARNRAHVLLHRLPILCGGALLLAGTALLASRALAARAGLNAPVAFCFALLGAALAARGGEGPRWRLAGRAVAVAVLGMSIVSILLLWRHGFVPAADGARWAAGFMGLGTGVAFGLGSLSLLLAGESARRKRLAWSVWLGLGLLALVLMSLLSVLFGFPVASWPDEPVRMALVPAFGHLLLGLGLLALRPQDDFLPILMAENVVGLFTRRLILLVLVLPPALGLLRLYLGRHRELAMREGLALFTVVYILGGALITLWAARLANRLEGQREEAKGEQARLLARLQQQAAGLQHQVAVRTRELEEANRHLLAAARVNSQLSLVASHTTSGVIIADARGRVEWANKAWEHMSGYELAEVLGRKPGQFLRGPETESAAARRVTQALDRGEPCYEEILNYAKDGRPYWQILDIEPVRNEAGEVMNFISVQTDITQFRESQQQLRGLTERLQLALRFSGYGVWEVDVRTGHMTWDARMFEIYGVPPGEFDGTRESWRRCMHPEDLPQAEQKFNDLVSRAEERYNLEFRIIRAGDGAHRCLEAQGYLQRDDSGRPIRVIGLNRDITAEQLQREQLRVHTERLQLALRASGYGVWDLDAVAGKIYWDARQCEIYGVRPDGFAGTFAAWLELIHPDDRERTAAGIRATAAAGDEFGTEFRIITPGGQHRHVESLGHLRRDAAGNVVRAVGMDRDVTGEKEMQEALRLAEQRWHLALAGTNDGVWDWNVESGSIFFDSRYAEILGYPRDELPQDDRSWMVLVHPDDLSEAMQLRNNHLAGQTPIYSVEHRMRARSGEWKWVFGRGKVVARDAAGRPRRMVGTLSDITARKQLEQTLRRNQELDDHVGRLAQIGGWEYDLRDNTLYWSTNVKRIHEVPDDYVPHLESTLEFLPPEMRPVLQAAFARCLNEGEPYDVELPVITATGRRIWVRTIGRADGQGGRRVRLYGAFQDITARHEAETARRQLEGQLFQAQKMETLGTLAGGIAHDFNNLLTGIMGYHDLAADVLPEDHQVRGYLNEARQASVRARELVEQILAFSRQQESPERMPIALGLVVGEAQRFLRATLPSTIQIQTEITPDCPPVLADSTQLHQVLLNLGSNAAHAMQARGGMLRFVVKLAALDAAEAAALGGLSPGRFVCLSVIDWGEGMDEATIKRIFDPFFTTKKPGQGTGLGLSVVHGIVRSHQGGIRVESSLGVGTTFHIFLPEAGSESAAQNLQSSAIPQGHGDTVFLVDDEEVVAKFAGIALQRLGYKVVTFDSALPCLEAIKADPTACAVLVTDQTMPGLTGSELIEAVHGINPQLRSVLMSGHFSKVSAHSLERLSHVEFLNKPFSLDELARAVERALHGGGAD